MMSTMLPEHFEMVVGLEVHLQFHTKTKIFCGCENAFGREPNTCVCPVCLGLPGSLPVLNKTALDYAIRTALALNCHVNTYIKFDRKNYYYPDLPKGYQISQYDYPIGYDGFLEISSGGGKKTVRVLRAHLEEDAGKLIHDSSKACSLVDYNRTGTPLMEIVTQPDMRSPEEAYDYLTALKLLLQYLDVSDCDMEKGSLRCDANISIRKKGEFKLGVKAELKNMNSFKAVKAALRFEQQRQITRVLAGQPVVQETRLWNEDKQATFPMRSKEDAHDYRYFPEPDLVPFIVDESIINEIRCSLPERPGEKFARLQREYGISDYDAQILIQDPGLADFFEACARHYGDSKKICNWIGVSLLKELNARRLTMADICLDPREFVALIQKVEDGGLSNLAAKEILPDLFSGEQTVAGMIGQKGLLQISDDGFLEGLVDEVIGKNGKAVSQAQEGNHAVLGFLIGEAMKASQGKGNPKKIGSILKRRLIHE